VEKEMEATTGEGDAAVIGISALLNTMDEKAGEEREATAAWAAAVEAERVGELTKTSTADAWATISAMKGTLEDAKTAAALAVTNANAQIKSEK
jgi:hypothetical protein